MSEHANDSVIHIYKAEYETAAEFAFRGASLIEGVPPTSFTFFEPIYTLFDTLYLCWEQTGCKNQLLLSEARRINNVFATFAKIFTIAQARSLVCQSTLTYLDGQTAKANTLLNQALTAARKKEMPLDEGLALLTMAHQAPINTETKAKLLTQAGSCLQQFPAIRFLGRLPHISATTPTQR